MESVASAECIPHRQMREDFAKALRQSTEHRRTNYRFGGQRALLESCGDHLGAEFHRPFAHLEMRDEGADVPALTIQVWDEASTGVSVTIAPPTTDPNAASTLTSSPSGRYVMYARAGTRFSFDRATRHMVGWVADAHQLTQQERGRPFMGTLHLWHQDRDLHAVHAGLVSHRGRGVLFGGASGSGKTTSALACLDGGFTYLGDDYAGLSVPQTGPITGHSVFCSTHIAPSNLHRFNFLADYAQPGVLAIEDKALVLLSDVVPERLGSSTEIALIVLPRVVGHGATRFRPATRAEAMLRVAPSSVFVQRASIKGRQALDKLEQLVLRTPAYWLDLGADVRDIPRVVETLLDEVRP